MIRKIETNEKLLTIKCDDIDVTVENGLFYSCLKPDSGLLKDLIDTASYYKDKLSILTANQIGYFGRVMVLKNHDGLIPMMNPLVLCRSGGRKKDIRSQVKYYKEIKLRYWGIDGRHHTVKLAGTFSKIVQDGLRQLGV